MPVLNSVRCVCIHRLECICGLPFHHLLPVRCRELCLGTPSLFPPGESVYSQEILPFLVIRTLIFHPVAKIGHAANLLAVIIRYRVGVGLAGRVDSVLFDASVKIFIFLETQGKPHPEGPGA